MTTKSLVIGSSSYPLPLHLSDEPIRDVTVRPRKRFLNPFKILAFIINDTPKLRTNPYWRQNKLMKMSSKFKILAIVKIVISYQNKCSSTMMRIDVATASSSCDKWLLKFLLNCFPRNSMMSCESPISFLFRVIQGIFPLGPLQFLNSGYNIEK